MTGRKEETMKGREKDNYKRNDNTERKLKGVKQKKGYRNEKGKVQSKENDNGSMERYIKGKEETQTK